MGLGGTKTKVKYGRDPRNTNWSNDQSRFGHKHLEHLGWKPGQSLGTGSSGVEGMTTHVKVSIKEDNTGLGKATSRANGEDDSDMNTGLDSFQRILGRLNGKEEKEVNSQLEEQRRRIVLHHPRFGMRFVHGGTLEGSVEKWLNDDADTNTDKEKRKSDKKRKRDREADSDDSKVSKKDKKDRKKEKERKREKEERRKEKEEKKEKKEKKSKSREEKESKKKSSSKKDKKDSSSENSTPQPTPKGRMATRMKYIAQKRAATADQKALNEILMVQA